MSKVKPKQKIKRRKALFTLDVPEATEVMLMGDFNKWNARTHPMKRNKSGAWEKTIMLPPGRYEYKFLVDGLWRSDPKNRDFCQNPFGTRNNVMILC